MGAKIIKRREENDEEDLPKSYVFRLGSVGTNGTKLVKDIRLLMSPNTAIRLKDRKNAKIRDYVEASSIWKVTHLMYLKRTKARIFFNIGRIPAGPKLTFNINSYALSTDVKRERAICAPKNIYSTSPLVIMHGFNVDDPEQKLILTNFQQIFPSIRPTSTNTNDIRRAVLFSYNNNKKEISMRHYYIKVDNPQNDLLPRDLMKGNIPDLSMCKEIGKQVSLVELGPRIDMNLYEINMELFNKKRKLKKKKIRTVDKLKTTEDAK